MFQKLGTLIVFMACGIIFVSCDGNLHKVYQESVNIPCETSLDCEFTEECNVETFFCQCRSGEVCTNSSSSNSIVTTKIGERCLTDSDCNIQDAFCDVSGGGGGGSCKCAKGFVVASSGKLCLKVIHSLADPCLEDIQCNTNIANSICLQNICACAHGMHDYNNTCHNDRALGETCQSTLECITPYSECHIDNICACSRRYIASNDKEQCLLAANSILSSCKKDEQCVATLGDGSHCFNNLCNCMYMYQFKASVKKCVRDMTLGEICSTHTDCHQPGSDQSRLICILNECQCKKPMFRQDGVNCVESSVGTQRAEIKLSAVTFIVIFLKNVLLL